MKAERRGLLRLQRLERVRSIERQTAAAESARAESTLAQLLAVAERTQTLATDYAAQGATDGASLRRLTDFAGGLHSIAARTSGDADTALGIADNKRTQLAVAERRRAAVEGRVERQARRVDRAGESRPLSHARQLARVLKSNSQLNFRGPSIMIQPATISAAVAFAPGVAASVGTPETAETKGEFAALLWLQLGTGTVADAPVKGSTAAPTVLALPGTGNALPVELPLTGPSPADIDTREDSIAAASVFIPVLSVVQLTAAAELPAVALDASAQRYAATLPQPAAPVLGSSEASLAQPLPSRTERASAPAVAALPRLHVSTVEERVTAASPEPARIALSPQEGPMLASPSLTFAVPDAPTNSPISAAASAPRAHAPHDFAALVDRLADARDTALAVQAPRAVTASIAHAEFGDVAIRFEHVGDALSVALSSPDPEFVRAVQAAAPAAQASMANDGGAPSSRHDAQGQHTGSSSGQSPQAQSQQRGAGAQSRDPTPHAEGKDDRQPAKGGIFA
jgi:hypothetical protein